MIQRTFLTILHVTDLHFYKPYYQWILEQIGSFDVLCITGDLIGEMHPSARTSKTRQINWVSNDKINNSLISNPGASFDGNMPNHKYITTVLFKP